MAKFLKGEGIYDEERLPTNAVLAVIAALCTDIPQADASRGQDELLLKKYLGMLFSQFAMKMPLLRVPMPISWH